jgi:hypothetical protein
MSERGHSYLAAQSAVVHGYLARRDDEADVVVPAMSGAFFAVLALWVAFFLFVNHQT